MYFRGEIHPRLIIPWFEMLMEVKRECLTDPVKYRPVLELITAWEDSRKVDKLEEPENPYFLRIDNALSRWEVSHGSRHSRPKGR